MKQLFIMAVLALSLLGCGGSVSASPYVYDVAIGAAYSVPIEGLGATEEDRRYDAVAYAVSGVKVGTEAYRAMLSEVGLYVTLHDGQGKRYVYVVRMMATGMHIIEG